MRSRFELDGTPGSEDASPLLASPEFIDEGSSRFVVQEEDFDDSPASAARKDDETASDELVSDPLQPTLLSTDTNDSWRSEVADRVNRYRARRRPRAPRYPSLTLKFEASDTRASRFPVSESPAPATNHALAMD